MTVMRSATATLLALLLLPATAAVAEVESLSLITHSGAAVVGAPGLLVTRAEAPVINLGGAVAVKVNLSDGGDAILHWRENEVNGPRLIVRSGGSVPVTTSSSPVGTLASVTGSPALDDADNLAFLGRMQTGVASVTTSNRDAIWLTASLFQSPPALWLAARQGNAAALTASGATGAGLFDTFEAPGLAADGTLQFGAVLRGTGFAGTGGIWRLPRPAGSPASNAARPLVLGLADAPGSGGLTYPAGVRPTGMAAAADRTAFTAPIGLDSRRAGLWAGDPAAPLLLATTDPESPGLPEALGVPAASADGRVAFWTGETDPAAPEALWLRLDGHTGLLARAGDSTPDGPPGEVFRHFSDPVLGALGGAAFRALVATSPDGELRPSLWTGGAAPFLRAVARAGEPAPGAGDWLWVDFGVPLVNRLGQLAFIATVRAATAEADAPPVAGLFATGGDGALVRVMLEGDNVTLGDLPALSVAALRLGGFNEAGQVAFTATGSDGREAVLRATLRTDSDIAGYERWAQLSGLSDTSPEADPDGDGIPNFLEFVFGLNPLLPDRREAIAGTIRLLSPSQAAHLAGDDLTLTVIHSRFASLTLVLETSSDLAQWQRHLHPPVDSALLPQGRVQSTYRIPGSGSAPHLFARLVPLQ